MSHTISSLHKRLNKLEGHSLDRDFEQEALDALSDEDLDALQEASALYHSGYSESEIKDMMCKRWSQVEVAIARYQEELSELMQDEYERPPQLKNPNAGSSLKPVNYRAGKKIP